MDAFYASVELRALPTLRGVPGSSAAVDARSPRPRRRAHRPTSWTFTTLERYVAAGRDHPSTRRATRRASAMGLIRPRGSRPTRPVARRLRRSSRCVAALQAAVRTIAPSIEDRGIDESTSTSPTSSPATAESDFDRVAITKSLARSRCLCATRPT